MQIISCALPSHVSAKLWKITQKLLHVPDR